MLLAIPVWQGRVSPVLDTAGTVLLVNMERGLVTRRRELSLSASPGLRVAHLLAGAGVQTLICGALSQALARTLRAQGVEVLPWMAGDIDDVLHAYAHDGLADPSFTMPGCCVRRRGGLPRGRCRGPRRSGGSGAR